MADNFKIPQPPIDRQNRREKRPQLWLGVVMLAAAILMLIIGAGKTHAIFGPGQPAISEPELVRLVTVGGVKMSKPTATSSTSQASPGRIEKVEQPPAECPT